MNKLLSKLLRCLILSLLLITILPSNVLAEGENAYAYSEDNDGTKTYYYSVQAAMDATRKNLTIVMCKDWQITSAIDIVEGTTSKIEMNGKAIRRTDSRTGLGHSGEVFTLHANSNLYLYGNYNSNTNFTFKRVSSKDNPEESITSGGLVTGGYTFNGGAFYMKTKSNLYLENVAISGNECWNAGGAIFVDGEDCNIHMDNAHINLNYSRTSGGGIYSDADGTRIYMNNGSTISHNSANNKGNGGAICFNYSWFSLVGDGTANISNNTSNNYGGAISVMARLFGSNSGLIKGVNIDHNSAEYAGGLYLNQNNITVKECSISFNIAINDGGGVYNNGDNYFKDVTIVDNRANYTTKVDDYGNGGGIYCSSNHDLTFSGTILIYDNDSMNPVDGKEVKLREDQSAMGMNGWGKDDVYLNGYKSTSTYAYIYDDGISLDSLIGLRTGAFANDVLLVKDLQSFTNNRVYFLDKADAYRLEYDSSNKELWLRDGTIKYTLYVDGTKYGEYDYNQYVTLTNTSGRILVKRNSENFYISESDKDTVSFNMPAYNLNITGVYEDCLTYVNLTTEALNVGSNFPNRGVLSFNLNGKDYYYYKNVSWVYKDDSGNWVDVPNNSLVEYNKSYRVKATTK